ncbi:hypothetical protein HDU88_005764 [Geranomyces variabilis]|nr:hypothetical protein HDU88_005764 [Geranomyces variabilis]
MVNLASVLLALVLPPALAQLPSPSASSSSPVATATARPLGCDELVDKFENNNTSPLLSSACYPATYDNVSSQAQANRFLREIGKCQCPMMSAEKDDLARYVQCPGYINSNRNTGWTPSDFTLIANACADQAWAHAVVYMKQWLGSFDTEQFTYRSSKYDDSVSCADYGDEFKETYMYYCWRDSFKDGNAESLLLSGKMTQTIANGIYEQAMQCACPHVAILKNDILAYQSQCPAAAATAKLSIKEAAYDKMIAACAAGDYRAAAGQGLYTMYDQSKTYTYVASSASRGASVVGLVAASLAGAAYLTLIL